MKITFKHEYSDFNGVVVSQSEHSSQSESLSEIMQEFRLFLLGAGFHPDSVENYIEAD